ncbi:biopolymer transport protein [Bernardetia litoralis DSM 6794]|uniref:Biopolymer transport protein n=1 Tax=Bernardetia litoralis (strain ATCC 23117 / DSM 6794 / NBRC 15988 / NCIMB 1366 / Fx l1 / Sio-4) TaxID=880071 RepID=I4AIY7_BERLS|nr:MotA/TolQ/ExbB proton channel family protein [Bernardetia litoralis]AFM03922.1 biopolymer transport protein [Bernardetia litoralis DSM 6794]
MKKLFSLLALICFFAIGTTHAQDDSEMMVNQDSLDRVQDSIATAQAEADKAAAEAAALQEKENAATEIVQEQTTHEAIKEKFIEGGWDFMSLVLICLIIGLAVAIERIIVLNLATTNKDKLLAKVEDALREGGVTRAQEVCAATRGPIADIFAQGLMSASRGIEIVEKTVMSSGSVEMSKLEKGLIWISLFIALAPMLGFMGTVIGMIGAFDAIQAAGDIQPSLVAGGIKVALLTTVGGLIVAIILQVFYNYCVSKIDSIVTDMEDASISLVDLLIKHDLSK